MEPIVCRCTYIYDSTNRNTGNMCAITESIDIVLTYTYTI